MPLVMRFCSNFYFDVRRGVSRDSRLSIRFVLMHLGTGRLSGRGARNGRAQLLLTASLQKLKYCSVTHNSTLPLFQCPTARWRVLGFIHFDVL